jgi:cytochrome c oxidase subunit 2
MWQVALVLFIGGGLILLLVMVLVLRAAFSGERKINARTWLLGGGVVFPVVVLTLLLVYGLRVGSQLSHAGHGEAADAMRIDVIAKRWWWEVRYHSPDGLSSTVLANELHLPTGSSADLRLTTTDVIHSFWVPALAGKVDMIPGHSNRLVVHATREGVYRGQCAEYCGSQHARMALNVVVEPPQEFQQWLARQRASAIEPDNDLLRAGQAAFFKGGCHVCHTIRGTDARGQLGPDLTHAGSRLTLAAGTLVNHRGAMAGWISGTQAIKPGALMPTMNVFDGPELRALSAYLESLE